MVNGELLVSFMVAVGGQGGQGAPVSGAALANLLQQEGPSLASTLSNAVYDRPQTHSCVACNAEKTEMRYAALGMGLGMRLA